MTPTNPRTNRAALAARLRSAMAATYGPRYKGAQLARDSGLSDQTVSQLLNEKRDPTPDSLRRIAPALNVPYAELLAVAEIVPAGGDEPETKPDPAGAMVRMLREQTHDIDDPERLAEIESNLRHQIRIAEEYLNLSVELLRREAAAEHSEDTDDASAS